MMEEEQEDNWLASAMNNVDLVVNVLINLRQSSSSSSSHDNKLKTWTTRQRRTQAPPVTAAAAKKSAPERASPTTPLSYSSGEGGGVDDVARSKVIGRNESTPTKRPRKKKTLAELKEDETALLKERKQLKRQVADLQATCEKRRKENESLNKMKNDMQPHKQGLATSEVNNHMEEKEDSGFVLPDLNIPAGEDE